jgi:hypothetical protein
VRVLLDNECNSYLTDDKSSSFILEHMNWFFPLLILSGCSATVHPRRVSSFSCFVHRKSSIDFNS